MAGIMKLGLPETAGLFDYLIPVTWLWTSPWSAGYMLTGYQVDPAGEAFLLCPVKGSDEGKCMITDARGALRIAEEYDMVNRRYVFNW